MVAGPLTRENSALAGMAQWIERCPTKPPVRFLVRARAWVAGLVPSRGVCKRQLIDVSLTHGCPLPLYFPLSLKQINKYE